MLRHLDANLPGVGGTPENRTLPYGVKTRCSALELTSLTFCVAHLGGLTLFRFHDLGLSKFLVGRLGVEPR